MHTDAIIIGAGQSGLAAAHTLQTRGIRPLLRKTAQIGPQPIGRQGRQVLLQSMRRAAAAHLFRWSKSLVDGVVIDDHSGRRGRVRATCLGAR